jgi:hypothetical protein
MASSVVSNTAQAVSSVSDVVGASDASHSISLAQQWAAIRKKGDDAAVAVI